MRRLLSLFYILGLSLCGCVKKEVRSGSQLELAAFVEAARGHYVARYKSATLDYRAKFQPSHPEVLFDYPDSPYPVPYRYRRVDLASGAVNPPNVTEIGVRPHQLGDPFKVAHASGIEITVYPSVWNAMKIEAGSIPTDIEPLTAWVWRWIDYGDTKPQDEVGFSEVIHSVTYPKTVGTEWLCSFDFGTAPRQAFEELMGALAEMGIRRVVFTSAEQ